MKRKISSLLFQERVSAAQSLYRISRPTLLYTACALLECSEDGVRDFLGVFGGIDITPADDRLPSQVCAKGIYDLHRKDIWPEWPDWRVFPVLPTWDDEMFCRTASLAICLLRYPKNYRRKEIGLGKRFASDEELRTWASHYRQLVPSFSELFEGRR